MRDDRSKGADWAADQRLRKQERLLERREYLAIQRRGERYFGPYFIILWADGQVPWRRLGVTASKKVGQAVLRNRAKRLLREAFRRNKARLPAAIDIVLIASPSINKASYHEVEKSLVGWARRQRRSAKRTE